MIVAWKAPMKFIRRLKKNRAIKSYVKKLPGLLAKDYGRGARYRPLQIKRTIERAGLDPKRVERVLDCCHAVHHISLALLALGTSF